jgi:hypothetical protein
MNADRERALAIVLQQLGDGFRYRLAIEEINLGLVVRNKHGVSPGVTRGHATRVSLPSLLSASNRKR